MPKLSKQEEYIDDVLSGRIVTSKLVRLTLERHKRDLIDGHERGLTFVPAKGQHIIDFIEQFCKHSQGEWCGTAFILAPWQACLLYLLYGWTHTKTGYRRFRFAYVELARGNGKSCLASAVALYELISEPGSEVYSIATKKEQAKIVFSEAQRMVQQSPSLKTRLKIYRDLIFIPGTASKFQPLSSDEDSTDGLKAQAIIIDELHAWGSTGRKLWDVLTSGLGKRRSPLCFCITTSGSDRNSVCFQQHEYSEKINAQIIPDDTWFSFICGLDEGDDYEDPANFVKANPNMNVSVKMEELQGAITKARGDPSSLNGTLRLRLGSWVTSSVAWLDMDEWRKGQTPIDLASLKGRECFGGLDLSTTTDISALVLAFPPRSESEQWTVLPFCFLPANNIEKRVKRDRVPYDVWKRQGLFDLTPGNIIDYSYIRLKVNQLAEIYKIKEIGFDPYLATQIVTQLGEEDGHQMVAVRQGTLSMSGPSKMLNELVLTHKLNHGNHPVLTWCAGNAICVPDPIGNYRPDKKLSREKIDPIIALIIALSRGAVNISSKSASDFYENNDIRVF